MQLSQPAANRWVPSIIELALTSPLPREPVGPGARWKTQFGSDEQGAWLSTLVDVWRRARAPSRVARHGASRELRRVVHGIAGDEAAHVALAFEIHAWLWPRLDGAQQSALKVAAARAIDNLTRPLPLEHPTAARVGAPAPAAHASLLMPLQALLRRTLAAHLVAPAAGTQSGSSQPSAQKPSAGRY